MLITLSQDDSRYAVASIVCAMLLFGFVITAKGLDTELRKPFVALVVAILTGMVIYASKAIPMIVIGILCLGLMVGMVRNWTQRRIVKQIKTVQPQRKISPQVTDNFTLEYNLFINPTPLVHEKWVKLLLPIFSVVFVIGFFCLIYLMFNKNQFMGFVGSMHATPSPSIGMIQPEIPKVLANNTTTKVDLVRETALRTYQQAKIEHETATHSVDKAWEKLSEIALKGEMRSWLKSQKSWETSKKNVCGQFSELKDDSTNTTSQADLDIKAIQCDTNANLNRASYIESSVAAMIKGRKPTDDIGNLIHNLSNR
jgi:flagellar basal body-associated protein FliL